MALVLDKRQNDRLGIVKFAKFTQKYRDRV